MSDSIRNKVLEIYHNEGHVKAWNYWRLLGYDFGIFLGEIPNREFIYTDDLLGNDLCKFYDPEFTYNKHVEYSPWLKFILDGKIIIVAKEPVLHNVSYDEIYHSGLATPEQNTTMEINGKWYNISLLSGVNNDVEVNDDFFNHKSSNMSEWDRLLYSVITKDRLYPDFVPASERFEFWEKYSPRDLNVDCGHSLGSYSWCYETEYHRAIVRGLLGIQYISNKPCSEKGDDVAWRPCFREL